MYYNYIYLDPRKPGKYCYNNFCLLYEPFYVGKGKNDRVKEFNHITNHFKNKINKIKQSGLEPVVFKVYENLSENRSFEFEKQLINKIGRINLKTGPLVNVTDGGEDVSGLNHSKKEKEIISEKQRKDFSEIKKEFEKRDYKLLTTKEEYKNNKQKLNYICPEGHKGSIRWGNFQQGQDCVCHKKKALSKNRKGENNLNSILITQDVIQIKLLLKEKNLIHQEIANIFCVSLTTVTNINNKKIWSYITI